jgi:hypothetical protein
MLKPPDPLTKTVASIQIANVTVRVLFTEKRDDFNTLVKRLGYHWQYPYWQRELVARNGTPQDRAAELAARLLEAGFCVEAGAAIEQQAIAAAYELEHTRWVLRRTAGQYLDHFVLLWERDADLYHKALRLTGAKYRDGHLVVPGSSYEEVQDFAGMHGFKFSQIARDLANEERAKWEAGLIVNVKAKRPDRQSAANTAPIGIAPDLLDTEP